MSNEKAVQVRCEIRRGGFPNERVFIIRFEGGEELRGVSPVGYCLTSDRRPIGDQPAPGGSIDGWVNGILIEEPESGLGRVYMPDSKVYELDEELYEEAKSRGNAGVPV